MTNKIDDFTAKEQEQYRRYHSMIFGSEENTMRKKDYVRFWLLVNHKYRLIAADDVTEYTHEYYANVYQPLKAIMQARYPDIIEQTKSEQPSAPYGWSKPDITLDEAQKRIIATKQAAGLGFTPEEQQVISEAQANSDIGKLCAWIRSLVEELGETVELLKGLATELPNYLRLVNGVLGVINEHKDAIETGARIVKEYGDAIRDSKGTMDELRSYLEENHLMSGDPYMPWPSPNFDDQRWTDLYTRVQIAKGLPLIGNQLNAMLATMQQMTYQAQNGIGYVNTIDALAGAPGISSGFAPGLGMALAGDVAGAIVIPRWFVATEAEFAAELKQFEKQLHANHNNMVKRINKTDSLK